jgi:hypothetical protein
MGKNLSEWLLVNEMKLSIYKLEYIKSTIGKRREATTINTTMAKIHQHFTLA